MKFKTKQNKKNLNFKTFILGIELMDNHHHHHHGYRINHNYSNLYRIRDWIGFMKNKNSIIMMMMKKDFDFFFIYSINFVAIKKWLQWNIKEWKKPIKFVANFRWLSGIFFSIYPFTVFIFYRNTKIFLPIIYWWISSFLWAKIWIAYYSSYQD